MKKDETRQQSSPHWDSVTVLSFSQCFDAVGSVMGKTASTYDIAAS